MTGRSNVLRTLLGSPSVAARRRRPDVRRRAIRAGSDPLEFPEDRAETCRMRGGFDEGQVFAAGAGTY